VTAAPPPAEPPREAEAGTPADPFDTHGLRDAVLQAWSASGTRLREDANTEEDHARGYYRDRVVVELAQNAADAAARAGEPGRLELRLVAPGRGRFIDHTVQALRCYLR
jgi:hypothetical protein